ncbi:MAG: hypothetical protein AB7F66_11370 [Bacteriovoracia bacterium]
MSAFLTVAVLAACGAPLKNRNGAKNFGQASGSSECKDALDVCTFRVVDAQTPQTTQVTWTTPRLGRSNFSIYLCQTSSGACVPSMTVNCMGSTQCTLDLAPGVTVSENVLNGNQAEFSFTYPQYLGLPEGDTLIIQATNGTQVGEAVQAEVFHQ